MTDDFEPSRTDSRPSAADDQLSLSLDGGDPGVRTEVGTEGADGGPIPGQLPLLDLATESADPPSPPQPSDRSPAQPGPSDAEGLPDWVNVRNVIVGLVVFGLAIRLAALGARPFHHDESLDAWFSWRFLNGTYDGYDPVYHGPLRFYITGGIFWAIGESETTARLLAAVSGAAVLAMVPFWRRDLGQVGTIAAVALAAVSPSLLYFSRVGREDSFFLAITFATVIVLVAFLRSPRVWHPMALFCLLVAGLAVKESVFITVFVFGGFGMVLLAQELALAPSSGTHGEDPTFSRRAASLRRYSLLTALILMIVAFGFGEPIFLSLGVYGGVLAAALVYAFTDAERRGVDFSSVPVVRSLRSVPFYWWLSALWASVLLFIVLFSQFFTKFSGPAGSAEAPGDALENGLVAGIKYWLGEQDTVRGDARWQYYLAVIPAYEWFLLLLAAVGIGRVLRRPTLVGQILVWWGVASFATYSWAGERMPWLMIHPLLPFVLLAGLGVQVLWDHRSSVWRVPVATAFAVGLLWTLTASFQASFTDRGAEPEELFVQAGQATHEVPDWVDRLYLLDRLVMAEEGRHLTVSIDSDVYWPYGWYLRDFPTGTYAVLDAESTAPDTDVIFVPHWEQDAVRSQLVDYTTIPYEHRWWWVPDFDAGPTEWGRWLWDRRPWTGSEDDPSDCPGVLVGEVYVRNTVYNLEQLYLGFPEVDLTPKPQHGSLGAKACERPDTAALAN